jgi:cation-transporting ATPase E
VDAAATLEYFARQGVDVRIISGDNPATVLAVANRAGLTDKTAVDGNNLPEDSAELGQLLATQRIFGRISPEQKFAMVGELQANGRVVAMTGDGVNDALALKEADLGIAMGTAASATKAVSLLVLLGNQFAALPGVVGEGRKVIANVERVSRLFLTKTVWAMSLAVVFGILLWSFPFLPRQLSATDGYTIGIPAFFLALLANQARYKPGFLRRSLWFCIPSGVVVASGIVALNLVLRTESPLRIGSGVPLEAAQTATALLMSVAGIWVLATLTRPLTGWRVVILAAMVVTGAAVFVITPIAQFFGFVPLTADVLTTTFAISAAVCLLLEVVNQLVNRWVLRASDSRQQKGDQSSSGSIS